MDIAARNDLNNLMAGLGGADHAFTAAVKYAGGENGSLPKASTIAEGITSDFFADYRFSAAGFATPEISTATLTAIMERSNTTNGQQVAPHLSELKTWQR